MAVAAANLSKGGGFLLLSYLRRGGGAVSRGPNLAASFPSYYTPKLEKGPLKFAGLKTSGSNINRVLFCTTSASSSVVSDSPDGGAAIAEDVENEEDKLKSLGNSLDIRVGQILKIWRHEEAESLYVEEVDVGESEPRIICSGLVKYIPLDHLQNKKVVVLANLKPRNMRGVKSSGMLMAASDASHENVELLVPPEGSLPGDRVWFGSEDEMENLPEAASPNQVQKKKIWESVQPHLKSDGSCVATLGTHLMRTSAGVVVSGTLKYANIS